jgi:hypothetical protein
MKCRWCDGSIIWWNERWCHTTTKEQKLCPTPLPYKEDLTKHELEQAIRDGKRMIRSEKK